MRPAQVPPPWCRIAKQPVRRRRKSKSPHSNLLSRLLHLRRFSKWLSTLVQHSGMVMTLDQQIPILASMQTPIAKLADDLCGLVQMQTNHPELLSRQIEVDIRQTAQDAEEAAGLADKAVAWMLTPVFFCCVVTEKVKPPQWHSWASTEVFSRVVVSFMLKLFVLAMELTGGEQQKQRLVHRTTP